jgi:hypothetical protein
MVSGAAAASADRTGVEAAARRPVRRARIAAV